DVQWGGSTVDDAARTGFAMRKLLKEFQHSIGAPSRTPIPVIAAIHGPVIGLGVDLISYCDVRYAASNATFCIKVTSLRTFVEWHGWRFFFPKKWTWVWQQI